MTAIIPVKAIKTGSTVTALGEFQAGDTLDPSVLPADLVPANVQSGTSYTLVVTDAGQEVQMSNASANTVNVPAGVLAAGRYVMVRQVGTGPTTVAALSGMNVIASGPSLTTAQQGSSMYIRIDSASTAYSGGEVQGNASDAMTFTGTLPGGQVGVAYSATLTLGGTIVGTVSISTSSGTKPSWMTITRDGDTVTCSGTPDTVETEAFTLKATDSSTPTAQVATSAQSVVIIAADTTMTFTGTLPDGQVNAAYSHTLTLGGTYTEPVTIAATTGSVPDWMTITVSGATVTCAGTPTTAETEAFTLSATDSSGTPQVVPLDQSISISAAADPPASAMTTTPTVSVSDTTARISFRANGASS